MTCMCVPFLEKLWSGSMIYLSCFFFPSFSSWLTAVTTVLAALYRYADERSAKMCLYPLHASYKLRGPGQAENKALTQ